MFSLHHCTAYRCLQSGVNSLEEADDSPLWLCPDWVRDFCLTHGLEQETELFVRSLDALG